MSAQASFPSGVLATLLGFRPGMNVTVSHAPAGFLEALRPLPEGVALVDSARMGFDVQVFFATKKTELLERLTMAKPAMAVNGTVWAAFPSEPLASLAPSEDFVRLAALELGLEDDRKVDLGAGWCALRLHWKPRTPRKEVPEARA